MTIHVFVYQEIFKIFLTNFSFIFIVAFSMGKIIKISNNNISFETQKMVLDATLLNVTLCRWSAKQTIPLSVLARNQTKRFGLEISGDRKWVREREKWAVGEGRRTEAVDTGERDQ